MERFLTRIEEVARLLGMELIPEKKSLVRVAMATLLALALSAPRPLTAQQPTSSAWTESASTTYGIGANIQYGTFAGAPVRLDVWRNQKNKSPKPTLIYIHGGGWVFGDKGGAPNAFLPFVERGWNIVNVEYRMAGTSVAPAAVEDVRCALRWVYQHSKEYEFDTTQLVAMGHSAGGHLALMEGMVPAGSPLDRACPADEHDAPLRVAAVVNWFGITDVADLLEGPNRRTYAVAWLGGQADREAVAKEVSPLTYVRAGLPPIITIHGDHDPTVPYTHAQRLDAALAKVNVPHELVTIPGGSHGGFSPAELQRAYAEIWKFLEANHISTTAPQ